VPAGTTMLHFIWRQSHTPYETLHIRRTPLKGYKRKKMHLDISAGNWDTVIMGRTCTTNDKVFNLTTLSICQLQMNDMWVGSIGGWWHRQQKTEVLRDSPVSVLFCSSPIPRGPARDWNQASVVKGQWWMEKEWSYHVYGQNSCKCIYT
jgi:hypothetical protein